jgi:hypothetical protein
MVEIIHFEKADKKSVKGYLDIKVPIVKPATLIIRKVGYLNNGNKKWFSLPSFTRNPQTEKPQYERYFEFDTPAFNNHLLDALHDKLKEYWAAHGITETQNNFVGFADEFANEPVPF